MGLWIFNTRLLLGNVYPLKLIFNHCYYWAPHRPFLTQDSLKVWISASKGHSPHLGADRDLPPSRNQCLWMRWCPPACHPFCHCQLWGCHRSHGEPWPGIHPVHVRWGSSLPGLWWILVRNAGGEGKGNGRETNPCCTDYIKLLNNRTKWNGMFVLQGNIYWNLHHYLDFPNFVGLELWSAVVVNEADATC